MHATFCGVSFNALFFHSCLRPEIGKVGAPVFLRFAPPPPKVKYVQGHSLHCRQAIHTPKSNNCCNLSLMILCNERNIPLKGNEGLDIKEGSQFNLVENNYCTGQLDPLSACERFCSRLLCWPGCVIDKLCGGSKKRTRSQTKRCSDRSRALTSTSELKDCLS